MSCQKKLINMKELNLNYKVTIIVANVKQFRIPFYAQLSESLKLKKVNLKVLYSDPSNDEATKGDSVDLPAPFGKKIPRIYFFKNKFLLQIPSLWDIIRSDFIIIVQANGYLLNYLLIIMSLLGLKRIFFWGHGYNRQGNINSYSEKLKRFLANKVNGWFAYTNSTVEYLKSIGVPESKIILIENAIDTLSFQKQVESIDDSQIKKFCSSLKIPVNGPLALYCGSLYTEKKINFLLECADKIVEEIPDFNLLIIGSGSGSDDFLRNSKNKNYIKYLGADFGCKKAICFRIANVFLNPGLVGLGILDSFSVGLPFITTKDALHSPEVDYLINGVNGYMVDGDISLYSKQAINLLRDEGLRKYLSIGAIKTSKRYSLENMVHNVSNGIIKFK